MVDRVPQSKKNHSRSLMENISCFSSQLPQLSGSGAPNSFPCHGLYFLLSRLCCTQPVESPDPWIPAHTCQSYYLLHATPGVFPSSMDWRTCSMDRGHIYGSIHKSRSANPRIPKCFLLFLSVAFVPYFLIIGPPHP